MGITLPWPAYCFNRAVTVFGMSLQNAIDGVADKKTAKATEAAKQRVIDRWLGRETKYRSVSPGMVERPSGAAQETGPTASASEEEVTFSFSGDGGSVG